MTSIGIIIPTYQAEAHLLKCLQPLLLSPLKPRILVIDSSSTDSTLKIAQSLGVETMTIPKESFNHGSTREMGRKYLGSEITMMLTQDAYLTSPTTLEQLIAPLQEGRASLSYARQIPHAEASFFGAFSRYFNYPAKSQIRSIQDLEKEGVYTYFCSNSCAAYKKSALDEIGGFPSLTFGEDSAVTAKLLQKGHKIAYVAEALVHHSHDYSLKEEFFRHVEIGKMRYKLREWMETEKGDANRGQAYAKALFEKLLEEKPLLIPYACLQLGAKWLGYKWGRKIAEKEEKKKVH